MAKAKAQLVPETKTKKVKTYVSTSGIFKKFGSHRSIIPAPRRKLHHEEQYNHRFANELVSYVPKKQAQPRDHPLAAAFNERIEHSREHIEANATTLIDSIHHSLTDRLASASAQPDKLISAGTALKEETFRPLGEDQLQFANADGVTKALLGDCMQSFKKVINHEEKALAVLWKEWVEVQQGLEDFAKEMLGPEGLKQFRNSKGSTVGGECGEQQEKLEQDVGFDRKRLEEELEKSSQQAVQKMLASEKEMDFLQRKQRKSILSMWEAQL